VEHLFDQVVIGNYLATGIEFTQDNVVMTTSHDDEVISEALWFFIYATVPARDYETTCKDWVIGSVGDDRAGETIRGDSHPTKY
jgi:methyl coenzyme M reductase alpha subunit